MRASNAVDSGSRSAVTFSHEIWADPTVINALLVAVSEEQLRSNLRQDLPLLILGSIIAAIGVGAVVVHLFRRRRGERVLLWFGLFAGPYGLRLLTNTTPFQMALGQSLRF